ncbi:MAG TPA: CBS domain-containing protein [Polyangia bacterium]|jgi:CBS domain-containing protein
MFDFDVRATTPLSESELLESLAHVPALEDDLRTPIEGIPRRPSLILAPQRTLKEAAQLMSERRMGTAMIASHGVLLGVLTERDMLSRLFAEPALNATSPVWMAMTKGPDTLLESDAVGYALRLLRSLGARALPVVAPSGALRGLFDINDIVAWLCDRLAARTAFWDARLPTVARHSRDE